MLSPSSQTGRGPARSWLFSPDLLNAWITWPRLSPCSAAPSLLCAASSSCLGVWLQGTRRVGPSQPITVTTVEGRPVSGTLLLFYRQLLKQLCKNLRGWHSYFPISQMDKLRFGAAPLSHSQS